MSYYCNLVVVGSEGSGKTSLIQTLMKPTDLIAKLPIPWYSKRIGGAAEIEDAEQAVIKCNLWEVPGGISRVEKLQALILWPRVTAILFMVNLGDQKAIESLDHWSGLLQELGWNGGSGSGSEGGGGQRAIVVGSYLTKSPLTSKIKDQVLQWCLDRGDFPFVEFSLKEAEAVDGESGLDWWEIISYFLNTDEAGV